MDIRELKIFRHLAESLHFGHTSRAYNLTPSTLTRTIQRLENALDEKLFFRDNRSVFLTPAGETFKKYADDVIERWAVLQHSLADDGELSGDISLYCSVTAVYSILPGILSKFREAYPAVQIKLETGDAARALTKVQNGEIDVSIAALPEKRPPRLELMKVIETPLVFITPMRFPETVIYKNKKIDWHKTPIIMAERGLSRERIDRWFSKKNVMPNIYARVAGNEGIIAMVSLGCGIGVVPRLVLEKSPLQNQIKIIAVSPQLAPFSIGVCTIKKNLMNPKIQAIWKIAQQETKT
ncbi:MAG: HTH-type transcriptional activator IlvY [Desulfobacterales bacterium]|nr:HTH-type transcriptional activator IlvY [Desulfobacterales bacterium]